MTKSHTKNMLKTVWYQEKYDKHYRKHKDFHKGKTLQKHDLLGNIEYSLEEGKAGFLV